MHETGGGLARSRMAMRIASVVGSVLAAAAVFLIATGPFGLSIEVPTTPGSETMQTLTLPRVIGVSLIGALAALAAAAIVARAKASVAVFLAVGVAGVLLSFVPTLMIDQGAAETAALGAMHVAVGAVSLTCLSRSLDTRVAA